ncbi:MULTISPECIES: S-layer homology domain-containing protein [unclassified Paenibacillus]|uniref:S-layer homology domain-containing protein n=1 Tax=unclassified Paenibacillus TaxID=185978 RepID=UPI0036D22EBA
MPGPLSAANSTVAASKAKIVADGTGQVAITVRLKDEQGHSLTEGGAAVSVQSTLGTVGTVTDNGNGTYSAMLTAPLTLGTATVSAVVAGTPNVTLESTAQVQFVVGGSSPSASTAKADTATVRADGESVAVIRVTLMDDYGHPLPGKRIILREVEERSYIKTVSGTTDAQGVAVFEASSLFAGTSEYLAIDTNSEMMLDEAVFVEFVYDQPPTIELSARPEQPTFGSVWVSAAASAIGRENGISLMKWAAGSQTADYFATQGTAFSESFEISENGTYTVYALDTAGNVTVTVIVINQIKPKSDDASLAAWELSELSGSPTFAFNPATYSYTVHVPYSDSKVKMKLRTNDGYADIVLNGASLESDVPSGELRLSEGSNTFEARVTAQNGVAVKTYTLNIIRAAYIPPVSTPAPTPTPTATPEPTPKPTSSVVGFNDIDGHWAKPYIEEAAGKGIMNGMPDGSFKPDKPMKRAEYMAVLYRTMGLTGKSVGGNFTDVSSGEWYSDYIHALADKGLTNGFEDGSFRPENEIMREEAFVLLYRSMKDKLKRSPVDVDLTSFKDADDISSWSCEAIQALVNAGVLSGGTDGRLKPKETITRAEIAKIMAYFVE